MPRRARGVGIVLFSVGFAPAVRPTRYEIGTTALLAAPVALLTVLPDRRPRLARVLPLLAAVLVSVVTLGLLQPGHSRGGPVQIMLPAPVASSTPSCCSSSCPWACSSGWPSPARRPARCPTPRRTRTCPGG
ncbi:hypothetical protein [Streptomyces sp. NPDC004284]|uniref:hypothetical protein n=1 Tax=Streptomyces sp. NPDC004284 TaxID=3364695 RepID=UPI0036CF02C3